MAEVTWKIKRAKSTRTKTHATASGKSEKVDRITPLVCKLHAFWRSFLDGTSLSTWNRNMNQTAEIGNLPVLQWLHANHPDGCTADALDGAAGNGHISVVEWLHANRSEGC
ncbi:unnamed protein product, partial [Heterosigma akashiwo]